MFNTCLAQEQKDGMTYKITQSIISSINVTDFEIRLNKEGQSELSKIDFSKYNFIMLGDHGVKIPIIPSTMSFRPPDVFVYCYEKTIVLSDKIPFQVKHIDKNDYRLVELKKELEKLNPFIRSTP